MKIIFFSITLFILSGCSGALDSEEHVAELMEHYNQTQGSIKKERTGVFTVIKEFYLLDGEVYKTKLLQHKISNKCYMYRDVSYGASTWSSHAAYLTKADCDI